MNCVAEALAAGARVPLCAGQGHGGEISAGLFLRNAQLLAIDGRAGCTHLPAFGFSPICFFFVIATSSRVAKRYAIFRQVDFVCTL